MIACPFGDYLCYGALLSLSYPRLLSGAHPRGGGKRGGAVQGVPKGPNSCAALVHFRLQVHHDLSEER